MVGAFLGFKRFSFSRPWTTLGFLGGGGGGQYRVGHPLGSLGMTNSVMGLYPGEVGKALIVARGNEEVNGWGMILFEGLRDLKMRYGM